MWESEAYLNNTERAVEVSEYSTLEPGTQLRHLLKLVTVQFAQ